MPASLNGPLSGVRIVDVTQNLSGPMATMILGDQGADVIKVEPPGIGDFTRAMGGTKRGVAPAFAVINRNKRSVALNLRDPRGLELIKRLVARADLFVQNHRPGVAERIGIGEAALRAVKSDLVYVSISGFGESGPYAHQRVYDPVIQAISGLAAIQADVETGRPHMIRLIIPDKVTALAAAQAMTAALFARQRTGEGQHVRLAMLDAVIAFLWPEGMAAYTFVGSNRSSIRAAKARELIFETADGFITAAANTDSEWTGLCGALKRPEWLRDERFKTPVGRIRNADVRLEMTAEVLKTKSTAEWLERLRANEVPCAPVLSREEVLRDAQVVANQLIVESAHPHAGPMRQPRPAARFERTPASLSRFAPLLGEHTDEVLAEAGVAASELSALRAHGVIA
ncbi:MAG TPA: CoA transferase [Candidatus Binataceae bacterium]|jgi:crotonobetainyl-CoA:carnitine CoA-transferase CaiB-like acyl-CoA transferase|nr:CoA transferase [Candidatus Binataceae bacterium]